MHDDPPTAPITAQSRPRDGDAPAGVRDPRRQSTARGALIAILVAVVVLIAFEGAAVERAGERLEDGWRRTAVLAVGAPIGTVSEALPFSGVGDRFNEVVGGGRDDRRTTAAAPMSAGAGGAISADAFSAESLGGRPVPPRAPKSVLVTGDSMSTPMDSKLARALADSGLRTVRDPRIGTSISQPEILDWPREAAIQAAERPDATVIFLGANEGFPLRVGKRRVECCAAAWAAAYATSVDAMMRTYGQTGDTRTYWLLLPLPRDEQRREVAVAVNAAIRTAAALHRATVRVVDLERVFTPAGAFRAAMDVDGRQQIVRESDGIHLNDTGSRLAADIVLDALRRDYGRATIR